MCRPAEACTRAQEPRFTDELGMFELLSSESLYFPILRTFRVEDS